MILLGREPGIDVSIPHPAISRRHAAITPTEAGFEIKDLGSANGTLVNGELLTQPRPLMDGDRIRLAATELHFSLASIPTPAATVERPVGAQPARLLVTAGPQEGAEFTLRLGTLQLGRSSTQAEAPDIALQDRGVSRPHAELRQVGEGYSLADVGSVNGTWVNGQELTQATILQDGDVIQLGETTLLYRAPHRAPG